MKPIARVTIFVAMLLVAATLLSSGVALAVTKTCQSQVDCFGTRKADTLKGTGGMDHIYGRAGNDTLKGFGEIDELNGQGGATGSSAAPRRTS